MKEKLFTHNFTFLILGQIFSLFGNYSLKFALSMYILEKTGSAAIFSGIMAFSIIPMILLSPFGGILSDRINRKRIMVALDALSGTAVLLTIIFMRPANGIVVSGILLIILSMLSAFESPTVQACIPEMLTEKKVLQGNAVVSQIQAFASIIAPFSGSIFYSVCGMQAVLLLSAALFYITAFAECFIKLSHEKPGKKESIISAVKNDFAASINFLCKEQRCVLKLLLLAAFISMFVVGIVTVGFPYLIRTVLCLSAEHYGAAESAMGIAAILGSVSIGILSDKVQLKHLYKFMVIAGLFLMPAGLVFIGQWENVTRYIVLIISFCGCQFAGSMFSIYAISDIQKRTPKNMTGKVISYVYALSLCSQPFAQILYGILFDIFADKVYLVILPSGFLICITALLTSGFFKKL